MLREKKCRICGKYFHYDDGIDSHGIAVGSYKSLSNEVTQRKRAGYCPHCYDPNSVPGETYKKQTVVNCFRKYLYTKGIQGLEQDEILNMMKEFPIPWGLYSDTTYTTFTLYTGSKFDEDKFELGPVVRRRRRKILCCDRVVACARCGYSRIFTKMRTLTFYCGFLKRRCKFCDVSKHPRNTSGLKCGGVHRKENSIRAIAKSLNISATDYRRHGYTHYCPPLPIGTIVKNLEVIEAYWDENPNIYAPKYKLRCVDCRKIFTCIQKRIYEQEHICDCKRN